MIGALWWSLHQRCRAGTVDQLERFFVLGWRALDAPERGSLSLRGRLSESGKSGEGGKQQSGQQESDPQTPERMIVIKARVDQGTAPFVNDAAAASKSTEAVSFNARLSGTLLDAQRCLAGLRARQNPFVMGTLRDERSHHHMQPITRAGQAVPAQRRSTELGGRRLNSVRWPCSGEEATEVARFLFTFFSSFFSPGRCRAECKTAKEQSFRLLRNSE